MEPASRIICIAERSHRCYGCGTFGSIIVAWDVRDGLYSAARRRRCCHYAYWSAPRSGIRPSRIPQLICRVFSAKIHHCLHLDKSGATLMSRRGRQTAKLLYLDTACISAHGRRAAEIALPRMCHRLMIGTPKHQRLQLLVN